MKSTKFTLGAEFEHDPANGIEASCGEVRQYIKWSKGEQPPKTGAFDPASDYSEETWYEDRDPNGKRYGHRSGPYFECVGIDHYEKKGAQDCDNGEVFVGEDTPSG